MILTVFRSRLKPENAETYQRVAAKMSELAQSMPGYVSHKTFTADDGERVTIVEFESEAAQRAWAQQPEHLGAQRLGRRDFYSEFRIQVCDVLRSTYFSAGA
ncbi:MAG: antibiotic biosynthesis monooxygenase [Gammaproteobacteria bacterium]|nr:antibiotic biosynthesis monooxygenase [Gammaproteobacteria bacterium]